MIHLSECFDLRGFAVCNHIWQNLLPETRQRHYVWKGKQAIPSCMNLTISHKITTNPLSTTLHLSHSSLKHLCYYGVYKYTFAGDRKSRKIWCVSWLCADGRRLIMAPVWLAVFWQPSCVEDANERLVTQDQSRTGFNVMISLWFQVCTVSCLYEPLNAKKKISNF